MQRSSGGPVCHCSLCSHTKTFCLDVEEGSVLPKWVWGAGQPRGKLLQHQTFLRGEGAGEGEQEGLRKVEKGEEGGEDDVQSQINGLCQCMG